MYLWKGHDAVPGESYAMQKSVADCPVDVEGMRSAACTATSNFAGSMRGLCSVVQLKQLITTI